MTQENLEETTRDLAKKLLDGEKRVIIDFHEYNDGSEKIPDRVAYELSAHIERGQDYKDLIVFFDKPYYDNKKGEWFSDNLCTEVYRMPYIEDLDLLEKMLELAIKQQHSCI
ncbi:hypothetical protein KY321_02975 [Candidatus Woesearchaeota archaeon]|nr:hypothetical protein [Candidatus Woesearchaeota archaeon]